MAAKARSKRPTGTSGRRQPAPEPGDSPLTRERIVAIAIDLLDAQGLDGFTMRQLADHLGSGVMSLYWHVENKEEVLDLALDKVLEYRGTSKKTGARNWRADVINMLEDWRASMLRHPWSASLLPRRALGPNILARLELLGRTLSGAGVADRDMNITIWSLWNHVMGATITRASFDLSEKHKAAAQQSLPRLSELYPTIERSRLLLDDDWNGTFRNGLGFLLDGLSLNSPAGR